MEFHKSYIKNANFDLGTPEINLVVVKCNVKFAAVYKSRSCLQATSCNFIQLSKNHCDAKIADKCVLITTEMYEYMTLTIRPEKELTELRFRVISFTVLVDVQHDVERN